MKQDNGSMVKRNKIYLVVLLITLLPFVFSSDAHAKQNTRATVRVGYYPVSDYQEIKKDGSYLVFPMIIIYRFKNIHVGNMNL